MTAWPPYRTGRFGEDSEVGNVDIKKGRQLAPLFLLALVASVEVVSAHHAFNTTLGVNDSLFTGPEWVALATDFSPKTVFS